MYEGTPKAAPVAAPPGGRVLHAAKFLAEYVLWARVAVQRRVRALLGARPHVPASVPPTGVLKSTGQWRAAVAEARDLHLPLHRDRPKNWDAVGAVGAVLGSVSPELRTQLSVVDLGAARYSPVLPWLRLYGLGHVPGRLLGLNLEFGAPRRRDGVVFAYGDAVRTGQPDASWDAVTCMSVLEHGIPVKAFLAEAARILRPGGVLCISTDYDYEPPDTTGLVAYGVPVQIFGPQDIKKLVASAVDVGLDLIGSLDDEALNHAERPVHWARTGLDYTFILLTFRRR